MESSLKTWLIRILFVVPVLCLIISVVLWKHEQNETFDIQTVKRELKEHNDEIQKLNDDLRVQKRDTQNQIDADNMKQQQQLNDEVEKLHAQKREMQSQIDSANVKLHEQQEQLHVEKREMQSQIDSANVKLHEQQEQLHVEKRERQSQIDSDNWKRQQQQQHLNDEVEKLHAQKRHMQSQIKSANVNLEKQQEQLHAEIAKRHAEKREMQNDKVNLKRQLQGDQIRLPSTNCETLRSGCGGGAVFVHWGRMNCSSTTDLVYSGIAGGGLYTHKGAAVNLLCMTHNPVWVTYGGNPNFYTFLYGTEYQVPNDFPFGHDRAAKLNDHDVPCSVCRSATRTSAIMIPGTTNCTAGWTAEYSGYLMAGSYGHVAATEYNCIDANPDAHESGVANENGRLLYRVKGKCGSLPCPPYEEMREITCVVCTK